MAMTRPGRPARPPDVLDEQRPAARGRTSPSPSHAAALDLQRKAGNAAVTHLLEATAHSPLDGSAFTVQRRTEPGWGSSQGGVVYPRAPAVASAPAPGVSEHLVTAAELADMPSTTDAPALLAENKALYAAREARRAAFRAAQARGEPVDPATTQFTPQEQARVDELNRKLKARMKGDEEETLRANGITSGHAAWFAEVQNVTFLGKTITAHRLLAERLARAEAALSGETPPPGGWFTAAHSLRKVGESLHSFGLAIDIDGGRNPYLVDPDAPNAQFVEATATSRAISDVINRAMLLVEGKTPAEADLQSRPTDPDKDARAMQSFDKLQVASNALQRYLELDRPDQRAALDALVRGLAGKDTRTAERWIATIAVDRQTLTSHASRKSWSRPETGFLHLDRRLVQALTSSAGGGLTWLGDDTIGSGRDIMHFDMRGLGPIRSIVKSLEGRTVSLGSG